mgnify:CR=1 FL=1
MLKLVYDAWATDRKGCVAAVEVMLGTDALKNFIRSNKIPQMETVMQGTTRFGMQTLIDSLAKLCKTGQISYETALEYSNNRTETEKKLLSGIWSIFCIYKRRHILVAVTYLYVVRSMTNVTVKHFSDTFASCLLWKDKAK